VNNAPASPRALRSPTLRLSLESDFSQVRAAAEQVQRFLLSHRCGEKARSDCELAVVEGCNNAIKHTFPGARALPVTVEVVVERSEIELRIIDHGPGFAWPGTIELPAPENESGRGLYLIRRLMDSACYVRGDAENILVLRKKRGST
jgi:anti-sigma regulatory factor (Ser/Thr protein kinase)